MQSAPFHAMQRSPVLSFVVNAMFIYLSIINCNPFNFACHKNCILTPILTVRGHEDTPQLKPVYPLRVQESAVIKLVEECTKVMTVLSREGRVRRTSRRCRVVPQSQCNCNIYVYCS